MGDLCMMSAVEITMKPLHGVTHSLPLGDWVMFLVKHMNMQSSDTLSRITTINYAAMGDVLFTGCVIRDHFMSFDHPTHAVIIINLCNSLQNNMHPQQQHDTPHNGIETPK